MKAETVQAEAERTLRFLAGSPSGQITVTREVARTVLLRTDGQMIVGSYLLDIAAKHLGAGVYRLSLREHVE
jgi:hypothetical protein